MLIVKKGKKKGTSLHERERERGICGNLKRWACKINTLHKMSPLSKKGCKIILDGKCRYCAPLGSKSQGIVKLFIVLQFSKIRWVTL